LSHAPILAYLYYLVCILQYTREAFPDEEWVDVVSLKFKHKGEDFELSRGIEGIKVAKSRLTGLKDDERILVKEIRQAEILANRGATVYLLPKQKSPGGENLPSPDALVNGVLFEFKNITGGLDRVEIRFRQSRKQCDNVYLKVDNPDISKMDIISRIKSTLKDKKYTGGTKGKLIIYLAQTKKTYFMLIEELT